MAAIDANVGSKSKAPKGPEHRRQGGVESARRVRSRRREETAMSEKIVTLDDATFDEHVKAADVPVLVDFWRSGVARAR